MREGEKAQSTHDSLQMSRISVGVNVLHRQRGHFRIKLMFAEISMLISLPLFAVYREMQNAIPGVSVYLCVCVCPAGPSNNRSMHGNLGFAIRFRQNFYAAFQTYAPR